MIEIKNSHFNLKQIAQSGQTFRWKPLNEEMEAYVIISADKAVKVRRKDDMLFFECTERMWNEYWKGYFDIDRDYGDIEAKIMQSDDIHLQHCFAKGSGIRILRQDLWEIIITFLISQNNNIKRITNSVEALCKCCGKPVFFDDGLQAGYSFPSAREIDVSVFGRKELGLGYRDVYLKEMTEYVIENPDFLTTLSTMSYSEAFEELIKRKGIGAKVANCVCLFGLHHVDAFPIDTHIKKLILKYYPDGFDIEDYKGFAGIAQQYLFYNEIVN